MDFRDLKRQYECNKDNIDNAIQSVVGSARFIQGEEVRTLESELTDYVGVKHCITCANGTDALQIALMTWDIGDGDAVFVPDFTFFSSGEVVSAVGATPIFTDVDIDTYNIDSKKLGEHISKVIQEGELTPKVVIAVDLFGLPADYESISEMCNKYNLLLLEDGAQGFGGAIGDKRACSFGDISTTSFFPAKPLGCYGDGGAIFTDNDEWAALIRSYCVHGKGDNKYDNVRIGMNSRLDAMQAAVLRAKLPMFKESELNAIQSVAEKYTSKLQDYVKCPVVQKGYSSAWAQYTIQLKSKEERDILQECLKEHSIPSMVYYQKPMHRQLAFDQYDYNDSEYEVCNKLCDIVLSLPIHPYMKDEEIDEVVRVIIDFLDRDR